MFFLSSSFLSPTKTISEIALKEKNFKALDWSKVELKQLVDNQLHSTNRKSIQKELSDNNFDKQFNGLLFSSYISSFSIVKFVAFLHFVQ